MAGGWGRYVGEWLVLLIVGLGSILWFAVMTVIVLPITLVKQLVAPMKPKEFSSILITGASSGIGAELARSYSQKGIKLVLTARRADKLAKVKSECEALGATVKVLSADVTDKEQMNKLITETDDEWPLDLVIANAGVEESTFILQGKDALEHDTQFGVINTNCCGVVNTLAPIMLRMKKRRHGQLVVMSSLTSIMPSTNASMAAYSSSKVWARAYGLSLRGVLASSGVGVTTLCPAFVESEMVDDISGAGGWIMKQLVKWTVIPTKTMVDRSKEAIAHDVAVLWVPFNILTVLFHTIAMNVLPPTLRIAMAPMMHYIDTN